MKTRITTLPTPTPDEIVVYFMGPGYGESVVIGLPDGQWIVIDACLNATGDESLPAQLLDKLGVDDLALLIITHPDFDHINGLERLIARRRPEEVWSYPLGSSVRDLMAAWRRRRGTTPTPLDRALGAVESLQPRQPVFDTRRWPRAPAGLTVRCLAPNHHDQLRSRREFARMINADGANPELTDRLIDFLAGRKSERPDHANRLSLAVAIQFGDRKLLFLGDLEAKSKTKHGWAGLIELLQDDNDLQWITDLDVIKLAHHGSRNAAHADAWALHAKSRKVDWALLTPYNRGTNPPPHDQTLKNLRASTVNLGLSVNLPDVVDRVTNAGWTASTQSKLAESLPCIVMRIPRSARQPIFAEAFGEAQLFQ